MEYEITRKNTDGTIRNNFPSFARDEIGKLIDFLQEEIGTQSRCEWGIYYGDNNYWFNNYPSDGPHNLNFWRDLRNTLMNF